MDRERQFEQERGGRDLARQASHPMPRTRSETGERENSGNKAGSPEVTRTVAVTLSREISRSEARRLGCEGQPHNYLLRESEIRALSDLGKFRAVDTLDLLRFAYRGDEVRQDEDLRSLDSQELIEARTVYRANRAPRRILTLSRQGQKVLRQSGRIPAGQRFFHGIAKPREIHHDADLYQVFQQEAEEIAKQGGRCIKVRLETELMSGVERERAKARRLPEEQRENRMRVVARQQGLHCKDGAILLPDLQIEYQTSDGHLAHSNLELVSESYTRDQIRGKVEAGFKLYARTGDSTRVRRALDDTGTLREILSL
jgi:hypothetical protein